jgi:PAS domain S-box-containing protein
MQDLPPDSAPWLAAIVESSNDAILSKTVTGTITSWNAAAERLFGYRVSEILGQSVTVLIPHERLVEEERILARIRVGQAVEPFDTVRRGQDGSLIDVSISVSPIRGPNGLIIGASTIARDIRDRKRMEADLRESQSRLLTLANASASIVGSLNMDDVLSTTVDVAQHALEADAYAVWRVNEEGIWHIVRSVGLSEEFTARVVTGLGGVHAPTRQVPFAEPLVSSDVSTEPLLAHLRDAYDREGIASLIVFPLTIRGERRGTIALYSKHARVYRDIDIQLGTAVSNLAAASLTAAELYDEQQRIRVAADHARQQATFLSEASATLSASLDYETTLKAVAHMAVPSIADWCAVDIVGDRGVLQRLAVAHVDPEKLESARRLQEDYPADPNAPGGVYAVLRTGQPELMSRIPAALLEAAARDDEHRRLLTALRLTSYMCVPLLAQGKAIGAITLVSAESQREYHESDLRFAQELATRASLAVEHARSYARAVEANRLKDEFLATLSHELRTPLNAVLGYARMLRLGTLPPEKTESAVEVVERNANALKQIISDVMDVSRIVAGRLRLNVEPVDLPSIVREACATVIPAADAKGVRLEVIIDPFTTPVSGDADRLQQVVWNLLSNAIKFTSRGGRVHLRLARVNSHVEITVSDTGQGIAAAFLPFVFERFRQGDAGLTREHGGLGLGLAIAQQLVELHGGSIAASSQGMGKGAVFTVKLPVMIVQEAPRSSHREEQPVADRGRPTIETAPRLDGLHVLAVDDDRDSLTLLRTVLEHSGAHVVTASSAVDALELLRRHQPDVMLSDIGMPHMDGLQLMRAIRQMEEPFASTPAAALTAYARSQDRVVSLASGFQMHLTKPIDPLELTVSVAALAGRGKTG